MNRVEPSTSGPIPPAVVSVFLSLLLTACSSSVSPPKGVGVDYQVAKGMFKQGNLDRVITLTDTMASANGNSPETLKARVLRAVIFSSRIQAYKELADIYKKGSQAARNPQFVSTYDRRRSNALQYAGDATVSLGEVVLQFTSSPEFPREVVLDAPWPSVEGPEEIPDLTRISHGMWVPENQQDNIALDAQHKAVDDVLSELVGGDRSKARTEMESGPVTLNGLDFALFLEKHMVEGLKIYGPNYLADPGQLKTLCGVADRLASPIANMLKEKPDKAKEAEFKKLQKQIEDAKKFT
jgi:hypothetical protein